MKYPYVKYLFLLCLAIVLAGCANKNMQPEDMQTADLLYDDDYDHYAEDPMDRNWDTQENWEGQRTWKRQRTWHNKAEAADLVVDTAKSALGTAYVLGGTNLSGFDCSGLVQWVYKHVGVNLPRTAREQSQIGSAVKTNDLREGDIVAFRHPRRGYHIGIYAGDGKFIHSPSRRSSVKFSSLDEPYFKRIFLGARRVPIPSNTDISAVQKRLAEYQETKSERIALAKKMAVLESKKALSKKASKKLAKKHGKRSMVASHSSKSQKMTASKKQSKKIVPSSKTSNKKTLVASKTSKKVVASKVSKKPSVSKSSNKKTVASKKSNKRG